MSGGGHGKGHGGGKHKKHEDHEEHENHERWLVSYADMMTLLFVLFVVMFAMSQVDQKKFAALRDGLATGFGSPSVAFQGSGQTISESQTSDAALDTGTGVTADPSNPDQKAQQAVADKALAQAVAAADRAKQQANAVAAKAEVESYEEIEKKINSEMAKQGMPDAVKFKVDERGLVVTVLTSEVVFPGDSAELLSGGQKIIAAIGPALHDLPNHIQVDGHTNQLPVPTVNYPSAWELSSARASVVVRYLVDRHYVAASRLTAAGWAGEKPLYPASDSRAATLNRRVEIVVLSTLSADQRALLPSAAGELTDNHATTSTSHD